MAIMPATMITPSNTVSNENVGGTEQGGEAMERQIFELAILCVFALFVAFVAHTRAPAIADWKAAVITVGVVIAYLLMMIPARAGVFIVGGVASNADWLPDGGRAIAYWVIVVGLGGLLPLVMVYVSAKALYAAWAPSEDSDVDVAN